MWQFAVRLVAALWHVIGLLLLVVLFVEYGIDWLRRQLRRRRYGRPTHPSRAGLAEAHGGAEWSVPYFDEFNQKVRVDWKEYVGWWQRPLRGRYVTIDERGLRATPGEREAAPDAVRILCFGGSTMMGMGARDDHTIPAVLARRLGALGHRAAITNFGQLGHNSTQELIALIQLLKQGARPDLVVFYDGINEMVCAEQTGAADRLMHEASRRAEFNLLYIDRRADLLAAALLALVPRTVRRLREWTGLPLHGPLPPNRWTGLAALDIPTLAHQVIDVYVKNLRLIRLLGDAYGFRPLFFWQPVIATKRIKTADEQFFESEFTDDLVSRRRLYEAIIAERRRHPALAGVSDVIDLSALFDEWSEPVYIDLYHLSEPGNATVAEAMLPAIAAAIERRLDQTGKALTGQDRGA